uniref:Prominin-like protein n=1 Tax=Globodera rostochiensis TaxID=31243 RepID=A0A914GRK9_GLORO
MPVPSPTAFPVAILLAILVAASVTETAHPGRNVPSSSESVPLLRFEPFRASEPYRCGLFAEQANQPDPAMRTLQRAQNALIRTLSRTFPHQKLLSDDALLGNVDAWKQSFVERRDQWVDFELWWLIGALLLVAVPPLFTLLYLAYRCVSCCCCRGQRSEKALLSDRRFDGARRLVLNALLGLLVVANIFCAAILLINTQYAQHGLDELPTRLHYCASDVFIYRSETVERIRKLLRDDFYVLNGSLNRALDVAGEAVVGRLKRVTGTDLIDEMITKTNNAGPMRKHFDELSRELPRVLDARHALQTRLLRLRQARDGLRECERTSKDGARVALCHQARQALAPVLELAEAEEEDKAADWESVERVREVSELLPEEVPPALRDIEQMDLEAKFAPATEGMLLLQRGVQQVVDSRRGDANDRLHALDRTLHALQDQLATTIKGVDLRFLDEHIMDPIMLQREHFRHAVHFGWIGALVVSGLFAFLALALLLGLCYGCCGRRPNEFDDDCCVRSTGASFFSCSIWLSLALMSVFGLIAAVAMLFGANASHLVCRPLEEPLQRPDFLTLLDRLVRLYGLDRPSSSSTRQSASGGIDHFSLGQLFTDQRRPADFIRECAQQRTLYTMFGLDKKFKLVGREGLQDDYQYLQRSILDNLSSHQLIDEALSHGMVSDDPRLSARQWHFFSAPMRQALQRLGQVRVPEWNASGVEQFCTQHKHFALEGVIAELRHLSQSGEVEAGDAGASDNSSGTSAPNHAELDAVMHFLEELRPDTVQVRAQLEQTCGQLEQLQREVHALRFNASLLLENLQHAETELSSKDKLRAQLQAVAGEVADELLERVRIYERHVNHSMTTEVSSCAPLASIASNVRVALCDYALDPLNSLWIAMAVGLALLLPIIVLATALNPLYHHTHSYVKYSMHTGDTSPRHDAFATDIYGMVGSHQQQQYHLLPSQQHNHNGAKQYAQQITSPMSLVSGGTTQRR